MADTEESSAQRQARIRREKREAKIKGSGQDRLDKITRLSGRTPESMRNESPVPTPPRTASPTITSADQTPTNRAPASSAPVTGPDQVRAQEELFRALLRNSPAQDQQQQSQGVEQDDPMLKMLNSVLSGMSEDPNAPTLPSLNPDDIAKATGLPSFVTNMMMGKQETPPTPGAQREARTWAAVHILFATLAGIYMLSTLDTLTSTFGASPPAPATFQNPVSIFVLGEALLHGTRSLLSKTPQKSGFGSWVQLGRDIIRDAQVMIFILGMYCWSQRHS